MFTSTQTRILIILLALLVLWFGFENLTAKTGYSSPGRHYFTGPVAGVLYIVLGLFAIINIIRNKPDGDKS